jgi:hypothetical protein
LTFGGCFALKRIHRREHSDDLPVVEGDIGRLIRRMLELEWKLRQGRSLTNATSGERRC